jgi:hypothetical protein
VEGGGPFDLAGFADLDDTTPERLATLVLQRLATNEGLPRDHYCGDKPAPGPEWPVEAPLLDWPVADHSEARAAFANLITRGARFRLLPIHGHTETGKSHLTNQFLGNALKMPDLACGRFDFKGCTDMGAELSSFAGRLGVDAPASGPAVSSQLAHILTSLTRRALPTLLIFDTFELAGDAERWIKETLLLAIIRAPWLRVIVVGQKTAVPHGQPWAGLSHEPIELRLPTAQEWFEFARTHKPELDLDFVERAHRSCPKSAVLAQLLGPKA